MASQTGSEIPTTFIYGEDGLTFWALRWHLQDLLKRIGDSSPAKRCVVFYRPSFGRRGGSKRSEFGEFDAILGTEGAVYLIESKWDGSGNPAEEIQLKEPQARRHVILRWIRDRWTNGSFPSWEVFKTRYQTDFRRNFDMKPLAPVGSKLARNLEFVLRSLAKHPAATKDILLFFHPPGTPVPPKVLLPSRFKSLQFRVVGFPYTPVGGSGMVECV